jgi:predicted Zn-dependent protease
MLPIKALRPGYDALLRIQSSAADATCEAAPGRIIGMKVLPILAILSFGVALAQTPLSVDKEIALGKSMAADIERRTPPLRDLAVQSYVNHLVKDIASRANLSYAVTGKVLDTDVVGATAAPGYVFVTAGMLAHYATVQELSSVIAHEIGHMAAHDIAHMGANTPKLFVGGSGGLCAKYPIAATTVPVASPGRANNREAEADRLALDYGSVSGSASSREFTAAQEHLAAFYSARALSLKQAQ